jgi:hypothetical protein
MSTVLISEIEKLSNYGVKIDANETAIKTQLQLIRDIEREIKLLREGQYPETVMARVMSVSNMIIDIHNKITELEAKIRLVAVKDQVVSDDELKLVSDQLKMMGISQKSLAIELGIKNPNPSDMVFISRVLRCDVMDNSKRKSVLEAGKRLIDSLQKVNNYEQSK